MNDAGERQVVLTVSGPGEVAGWVYPVGTELKRLDPDTRVVVAALPCVFATGAEGTIAAGMKFIDDVVRPVDTVRFIAGGKRSPVFAPASYGCLLHLGGEPALSLALARRLRYPALAFTEHPLAMESWFETVFFRDAAGLRGRPVNSRRSVAGDLVVDSVRLRCPSRTGTAAGRRTVGIFGGSRVQILRHMLPFFVRVAALVESVLPGHRWIVARADSVGTAEIEAVLAERTGRALEGESARRHQAGDPTQLISDTGVRLEVKASPETLAEADLALAIPGTSTGELAALGIPMVVAAPHAKLDAVPLPGALGHLDRIPLASVPLKRAAVYCLYGFRRRTLAYPNVRAGRLVVPELQGQVSAQRAADALIALERADVDAISRELRRVMGPPGAATTVASRVLESLREVRV